MAKRPTEKVTAASALLAMLETLEGGADAARMRSVIAAARLVRDESRDREKQVAGYRELLGAARSFLGGLRLKGEQLARKHQLVGMIAECEDASVRLDVALLSQAAEVPALIWPDPAKRPKLALVRSKDGER